MSVAVGTRNKEDGVRREPSKRFWMDEWRPEDAVFWAHTGARVARRNSWFSVFAEHVGFSVWSLWSVFVLFLGPNYHVDPAGKFVLTAVPALVGSILRLPYSLGVAKFGGRNWTIFSVLALLVPTLLAAAVMKPGVSYATLLAVAAAAGIGGGNFASAMTNINAFYPERLKGRALGINAGGGNIGVATVQLVAVAVLTHAGAQHPRVIVGIYIPLIVLAAVGSALFMNNLTVATNATRALRDACHDPHTWIISLLYVGTFGSFIGFGFAFGQVLQVQFKADFATPVKAAEITFLGPLIGSLIRPVGGMLADRFGGAKVTFANFAVMALSAGLVLVASLQKSLGLFFVGFVTLFALTGIGNGSTYKMIPAIFRAKAHLGHVDGLDAVDAERTVVRLSGTVIGIAGALGAFGGVLVNLAFRQSFLSYHTGDGAYIAIIAFYVACGLVTWAVYLRRSPTRLDGV